MSSALKDLSSQNTQKEGRGAAAKSRPMDEVKAHTYIPHMTRGCLVDDAGRRSLGRMLGKSASQAVQWMDQSQTLLLSELTLATTSTPVSLPAPSRAVLCGRCD